MKIELYIKNLDNVGGVTSEKIHHFEEIFEALIETGGLTGVKGGQTIIHFDPDGVFKAIQLDYYPWRKKKM